MNWLVYTAHGARFLKPTNIASLCRRYSPVDISRRGEKTQWRIYSAREAKYPSVRARSGVPHQSLARSSHCNNRFGNVAQSSHDCRIVTIASRMPYKVSCDRCIVTIVSGTPHKVSRDRRIVTITSGLPHKVLRDRDN